MKKGGAPSTSHASVWRPAAERIENIFKGKMKGRGGGEGVLPRPALPLNFWETGPLLQAVYCPLLEVLGAVRFSKVGALGIWTSYTGKHSVSRRGGETSETGTCHNKPPKRRALDKESNHPGLSFPCTQV